MIIPKLRRMSTKPLGEQKSKIARGLEPGGVEPINGGKKLRQQTLAITTTS